MQIFFPDICLPDYVHSVRRLKITSIIIIIIIIIIVIINLFVCN